MNLQKKLLQYQLHSLDKMLWRMMGADHPMEAHKIDSRAVYALVKSGEAAEGIKSFFEKTPAKFSRKINR